MPAELTCCPACKRPLPDSPRARAMDMVAGKGVTPRQLDTLTAVLGFADEHGFAPTYRELGPLIGASYVTALEHVHALVRKGVLTIQPNAARAIRV